MYRTVGAEEHDDLRVGHEVLSITAGRRSPGDNETLWWNDKVQEVIKANKEAMKMWETSVRQIAAGRQTRRHRKHESIAQPRHELYEELETPECETKISDSEGQGFHQEQSDKGRTSRTFKGPV